MPTIQTLRDVMRQGRPSVWWSIRVLEQVARQLDEAHADGRTHGHLTSAMISFGAGGTALVRGLELETTQRRHATVAGDVFALAAIAYELLTGSLGEERNPPSILNPALPTAMDAILGKALSTDPQRRYRSAGVLVDQLRQAVMADPPLDPDGRARSASAPARVAPGAPGRARLLFLLLVSTSLLAFASSDPEADLSLSVPGAGGDSAATASSDDAGITTGDDAGATSGDDAGATSGDDAGAMTGADAGTMAMPELSASSMLPVSLAPHLRQHDPPGGGGGLDLAARSGDGALEPAAPDGLLEGPAGLALLPEPLPIVGGAIVQDVIPGSPADRAGIVPRDVIVAWGGTDIGSPEDLTAVPSVPRGDADPEVDVVLYREERDDLVERTAIVALEGGR